MRIQRSLYCGHVSQKNLDQTISLCGWVDSRRDHGGLIFIDLRDRTGIVQLVCNPDFDESSLKQAHKLRNEFVICVRGTVVRRTPETVNAELPTGGFEVRVTKLEILNTSQPLPFQLDEAEQVDEETRLAYRYLDMRRPAMQQRIRLRHDLIFALRSELNREQFYEIETPILSKSTPEGARDFLVPSRLHPSMFYALPQSPQLYKQLLISGGVDKYFQIARCFRDEDLRANRQPEFTQLDLEMSFTSEEEIQALTERLISTMWDTATGRKPSGPFPRISYNESIARFGTDAPDMRFGLEISDISALFKNTELKFLRNVLDSNGHVGAIVINEKTFTRSELDGWVTHAQKQLGAKGLLYIRFNEDGSPDSPVSKFLPNNFLAQVQQHTDSITTQSTLFIIAGPYKDAWHVLGRLRNALAHDLGLIKNNEYAFVWVVDFPLLEWNEEDNRWYALHHPFTMPHDGWENTNPGTMKARAYDLVCNGQELGGGSIRIYQRAVQEKIFSLLSIDQDTAQNQFGFLLRALEYGFPPLGGIALGLDRIIMILAHTDSIRDVIVFPKTQSGYCPLMETPSSVDQKQLRELHIKSTWIPPKQ